MRRMGYGKWNSKDLILNVWLKIVVANINCFIVSMFNCDKISNEGTVEAATMKIPED